MTTIPRAVSREESTGAKGRPAAHWSSAGWRRVVDGGWL